MRNFRFYTAVLLAAASFSVTAETLTPEEALSRAMGAGISSPALKSAIGRVERPRLIRTVDTPAGVPGAYVFSRDGGYVVVAADDVALPLLGYSDEALPEGDAMPPQMKWWLGEYGRQIDYARTHASERPRIASAPSRADRLPIAPLLTTLWNQDAPYNDLCPEISGKRAVTGCVATAMAQVMKYHNYPQKGLSSISYPLNGQTLSMNFAQTTFDWGNMLDSYTGTYTSAQSEAVATLMKACGYATKMQYTASESGTSSQNAAIALRTYFGYNAALELKDRDFYPLDQWETMFYENLRDCGPVLCGGADYSMTSGHEFVCDGYSADGFFHFNWGWGGAYDGYFLLTALNPAGVGIGGGIGDGFNFGQDAIFGIMPPTGAPVTYDNRVVLYGVLGGSVNGSVLTLNAGDGGAFLNNTDRTFGVQLGAKLVSSSGQATYAAGPTANGIQPGYGVSEYQVALGSLSSGTYKVYPVCRPSGNGASAEWLDIPQKMGNPGFLVLTAGGGSYSVATETFELPKAANVKAESPFFVNCPYSVSADLTNVASFEMFMPVASAIATLSNNTLNLISRGEVMRLDLNPGATANYTFTGTFGTASTQAGEYYFVIYDPDRGEVLYYSRVNAQANPGKAAITCSSFTIEGGNQNVNAAAIRFNANVSVTSGYLSKPLVVAFFDDESPTSIDMAYFPVKYLSAGQSASLTTTCAFSAAKLGGTYTAGLFDPDDTSNMLASLNFTVGTTSGVENVNAQGAIEIVSADGGIAITASAGIASVGVYRVDGAAVAVPVATGSSDMFVPAGTLVPGVYAVSVTDMAGHTKTQKIAIR